MPVCVDSAVRKHQRAGLSRKRAGSDTVQKKFSRLMRVRNLAGSFENPSDLERLFDVIGQWF